MLLGELAALTSALLWAVTTIVLSHIAGRLSVLRANAIRMCSASLFFLVLIPLSGGADLFRTMGLGRALAFGCMAILGMGIGDSLYFAAVARMGASRASPVSISSFPLITLLLGALLLGEHLSWSLLGGGVLVIGGIVLMVLRPPLPEGGLPTTNGDGLAPGRANEHGSGATVYRAGGDAHPPGRAAVTLDSMPAPARFAGAPDESPPARGVAARHHELIGLVQVVGAAVAWSVSTIWLRSEAHGVPSLAVSAVRVPAGALFLLVATGAHEGLVLPRLSRQTVLLLLGAGIVGSGAGSLLYIVSVQRAGAGVAAILSSTSPLWVLPMAAVFLHERLTRRVIIGAALAVAGIWLVAA